MPDTKAQFRDFFDRAFKDKKKQDFEDWFVKMAGFVWGDDFENIKPSGPKGDKKCDGRRISAETIFQCYAPENSSNFAKEAAKKIADSFPEVVKQWPNIKKWVLVHNNDGLPPNASNKLEELRKNYPHIDITTWGRERLKDELHDKLLVSALRDVYPESNGKIEPIKIEHIKPLLDKILREAGDNLGFEEFGKIPSKNKLDFNDLSERSKQIIRRGWLHVKLVQNYVNNLSKPENADKLQNSIRNKYEELDDLGYLADDLLMEFLKWLRINDTHQESSAIEVIIAYFFESCDIFKNLPEE